MQPFQGWWRQCTRSQFKPVSTHCWRWRHSVTASATYAMTLVTAWMLRRRDVDLLVPAGTSIRLDWIQCGFNIKICTVFFRQIRHTFSPKRPFKKPKHLILQSTLFVNWTLILPKQEAVAVCIGIAWMCPIVQCTLSMDFTWENQTVP
jgi:hypothetical protein